MSKRNPRPFSEEAVTVYDDLQYVLNRIQGLRTAVVSMVTGLDRLKEISKTGPYTIPPPGLATASDSLKNCLKALTAAESGAEERISKFSETYLIKARKENTK